MEAKEQPHHPASEAFHSDAEVKATVDPNFSVSKTADGSKESQDTEGSHEYISGLKLALVLSCVTLVGFLFLLDISIVSTVGYTLTAIGLCFND